MNIENLLIMNIKNDKVLVELFSECTYDGKEFTSAKHTMVGEPFIMDNCGKAKDQLHVLMQLSQQDVRTNARTNVRTNSSAIGEVVGHIDPDTEKLMLYKESLRPFVKWAVVV